MADQKKRISLMSAMALEVAFNRFIIPQFEKTSGYQTDVIWAPTAVLMRRIGEGERADVVVAIDGPMDQLAEQGVILARTRVPIAQSVFAIAVKSAVPRPDMSNTEAFKRALVNARAIAYSDGGVSGIYFAGLIEQPGIADAVRLRAVTMAAGFTAEKLVTGEAEIAVQQISELMSVPDIDLVGPFPNGVQAETNFSVAIFADAANPEGAAAFIQALSSRDAESPYHDGGLVSRLHAAA